MKKLLFLLLIIYSSVLTAQKYDALDKKVRSYPNFNDVNHLAIRIQNDFTNDNEKVRAIFIWITNNIKYNTLELNPFRTPKTTWYRSRNDYLRKNRELELKKIQNTLITKKALCGEYSLLLKELCSILGIKSVFIQGLTKTDVNDISSNRLVKDHAWNSVFVNNEWKLIDVTWASGYVHLQSKQFIKQFNDSYFFANPKEFILHHYPENNKWQLLDSPINKHTFFKKPIFFQDYHNSKIKLSDTHSGIIPIKRKKYINIIFDSLPEIKKMQYSSNDLQKKTIRFKYINGQYIGKIKITKKIKNTLTLYYKNNAIIKFKLEIKN